MDNFSLFKDLGRGWWYFIIDYTISKRTYFLMRYILQMCISQLPHLSRLFYLSTSSLFNSNLSTSSLLMNFILTYRTWFPSLSSLEFSDNFHLVSKFLAISISFFGCCEYWLLCIRINLHYERIDNVYCIR